MRSVTRRGFMKTTGMAAAALAAPALLPRMAFGGPVGLPYGIQLYTVGKDLQMDTVGTLKKIHGMGYREVETAGLAGHTPKEFKAMLDDAGLVCPSIHMQFRYPDVEATFAEATALGAKYAVCSNLAQYKETKSMPPMVVPIGLDGFKELAGKLNELGKKAHAAGLQYAYHNHNREFEKLPDGTKGYDLLIRETDPALVKFEIDCGWMVIAGADPVAYFKKYPGRFKMLHIKDFKKPDAPITGLGKKVEPHGMNLGTGFVDYKPIFAAAKPAGIEHVFVEQEAPFPASPLESAQADFAFMQKLG